MPKANIHDRHSLEAAYPPDAFASDAAENGRSPTSFVKGVRILSAPDAAGDYTFERATQQVGEALSANFLAPQCREERLIDAGRDSPAVVSAQADPAAGYEEFLADLVAAAQRFGFKPNESPGVDEPRLKGLRQ
jgi:hypothetical protein